MARKFTLESISETVGGHSNPRGDLATLALEAELLARDVAEAQNDATRMEDVATTLGDLAVVVDERGGDLTPTEQRLIQVAGDLATAGTDQYSGGVATESFLGTRYSAESIRETASKIWKALIDAIVAIWNKIASFFGKSANVAEAAEKGAMSKVKELEAVKVDRFAFSRPMSFELTEHASVFRSSGVQLGTVEDLCSAIRGHCKTIDGAVGVLKQYPVTVDGLCKLSTEMPEGPERVEEVSKMINRLSSPLCGHFYLKDTSKKLVYVNTLLCDGMVSVHEESRFNSVFSEFRYYHATPKSITMDVPAIKLASQESASSLAVVYSRLAKRAKEFLEENVQKVIKEVTGRLAGLGGNVAGGVSPQGTIQQLLPLTRQVDSVLLGVARDTTRAIVATGWLLDKITAELKKHAS